MSGGRGAAVSRLADYVHGARPEHLAEAAHSWIETTRALNRTRETLRWAAAEVRDNLSGEYAESAQAHFDQLARVTIERQREVREAGRTLGASADALAHAQQVHEQAEAAQAAAASGGAAGGTRGRMVMTDYYPDPWSEDAITRDRYRAQQQRHDDRTFDDHEQAAAAETNYLDHVFDQTSDRMQEVDRTRSAEVSDRGGYDVPDPERGNGRDPRTPTPADPGPRVPAPGQPGWHTPTSPVPTSPTDPSTSTGPGPVPGPGTSGGVGPDPSGTTSTGGGPNLTAAGLALGAGGLGAGALAAGIRGGTLSASGIRGIGAAGPTSGAGVLARGTGAGGTGTGAGGRAGSAGGRAGAGGGSTNRGGAGARRGSLGTGAGGRSGRRKDDEERDQRDGIDEDPDQWLEDDATGPEVMGGAAVAAAATRPDRQAAAAEAAVEAATEDVAELDLDDLGDVGLDVDQLLDDAVDADTTGDRAGTAARQPSTARQGDHGEGRTPLA